MLLGCIKQETEELLGTGTAAVISPCGMLSYRDSNIVINNMQIGELAHGSTINYR
jgi:branched-chain amino acid aminotransferase